MTTYLKLNEILNGIQRKIKIITCIRNICQNISNEPNGSITGILLRLEEIKVNHLFSHIPLTFLIKFENQSEHLINHSP